MTGGPVPSNLRVLSVSLASMQGLLDRRTTDGMLVPAAPALIEAAIASGRVQAVSIRGILRDIPPNQMDPWQGSIGKLLATVSELERMLDELEEILSVARS